MSLIIGTRHGVYRRMTDTVDEFELVVDAGDTLRIEVLPGDLGMVAASKTGLYRSVDEGSTWDRLPVPQQEVFSVAANPDGSHLYAGTHPAHLFVSKDGGDSWTELEALQSQPTRSSWHTPRHRNAAHIRSLDVHPSAPNRVIVGVEVGGVHVSDDRGNTWSERRIAPETPLDLRDDIHHILVIDADSYVASCGKGLYGTADAGHSWDRLDEDYSPHSYFRETIDFGEGLYSGAQSSPGTWHSGDGPILLNILPEERRVERVPYPGQERREFVVAWSRENGQLVAGTDAGRLIRFDGDKWATIGMVPSSVRSIASIPTGE